MKPARQIPIFDRNNNVVGYEIYKEEDFCQGCNKRELQCEHYMVKKHIWDKHGAGKDLLCLSCLENRLERDLTVDDFSAAPLNYGILYFLNKVK